MSTCCKWFQSYAYCRYWRCCNTIDYRYWSYVDIKNSTPENLLSTANNGDSGSVVGTIEGVISNNGITTKAFVFSSDRADCDLLGRLQIGDLNVITFVNKFSDGGLYPVQVISK